MAHLIKNQHIVPNFYLTLWCAQGRHTVTCHDLKEQRAFPVSPATILRRRYFYEEDPATPDNRIENLLSQMEGQCSSHFQKLWQLPVRSVKPSNEKSLLDLVRRTLSDDTCMEIKTFAAFQYLRIPGAMEQKKYELQTSTLAVLQKDYLLNAGRFVETGFTYMRDKFQSLKLIVMLSTGQDFITSDWPCFDVKDADRSESRGHRVPSTDATTCRYFISRIFFGPNR